MSTDIEVKFPVPCSFAPANRDGSMGQHYVFLRVRPQLFYRTDTRGAVRYNSLSYVSCQCLDKHGEAVQAMQDMGAVACYQFVNYVLRSVRKEPNVGKMPSIPEWIKSVVDSVVIGRDNLKTYRAPAKTPSTDTVDRKMDMYVRLLNNLSRRQAGSYMCKDALVRKWHSHLPVPTFHRVGRDLVTLRWENAGRFVVEGDKVQIVWNFDPKAIAEAEAAEKDKYCRFCQQSYDRYSKHASGQKHVEQVKKFYDFMKRATSPTGLKMLTSPRYKHIFLSPNATPAANSGHTIGHTLADKEEEDT